MGMVSVLAICCQELTWVNSPPNEKQVRALHDGDVVGDVLHRRIAALRAGGGGDAGET